MYYETSKFYLISLSEQSSVELDLLLDFPGFLEYAGNVYAGNDFDTAIELGLQFINENF